VFSPNARTFLKFVIFVIYMPTDGSDLLLTITRNSLCWSYKCYPLEERCDLYVQHRELLVVASSRLLIAMTCCSPSS
jgi:hypothetical protein